MSKILIIEDNTAMRDTLGIILERYGFTTLKAPDGPAGIAMARSEKPDLILLDLMMPYMPGEQVARYMRDDPTLSSIPIVVLTAMKQRDSVVNLLTMKNVHDYLLKPANPDILRQRLQTVLDKTQANASHNGRDHKSANEVIRGEDVQ